MPDTFHLLVPYAAASAEPAQQALALPRLSKLLARLHAEPPDDGDEFTLTPPHERALARALGLPHADGLVPWAAWEQWQAGRSPAGEAWAVVAPAPWHVGTGQVSLGDPAELHLDEAASRELLAIVSPFFAEDGITLTYVHPTRWLARGEPLRGLPTASPDRVIGRSIDIWQPAVPQTRALRRLQSEIQMLLYTHAFNDAREAARLPVVNGFWLSGAGALDTPPAGTPPTVVPALREAALREDWAGWNRAWEAIDNAEVADALARAERGEPVRITLCGERRAQSFATGAAPSFTQRLRGLFQGPKPARDLLENL